ncbi:MULTISPECIES: DUF2505 domain-containing protein [Actinoalloteichus]|uniref:DUF2505 family protein n=1 Tax=Actinoalloteichus fjordicus TaxID=1612552 RepID=A0AAC9L817_9PSEU|nr:MULTISPECIES: DUF2505 domain-containing protein [Actinoalloteichus]APU12521.1 putative DUF2505 family protein [Actinoalloteichus fjordicus]APU18475.1 putative DUF2505 family protein [Actinoalloteichus sp. GBA129-24]
MARPIQFSVRTDDLKPEKLYLLLVDEEYLAGRLRRLGGPNAALISRQADDAGATVQLRHGISAGDLPKAVRSLAPNGIVIDRTETWTRVDDQRYEGVVIAEVEGARVRIEGRMLVEAHGIGAQMLGTGTVTARIPLMGGMVEGLVAEEVSKLLNAESRFTLDVIAGRPTD